jgi:hypothetical protein
MLYLYNPKNIELRLCRLEAKLNNEKVSFEINNNFDLPTSSEAHRKLELRNKVKLSEIATKYIPLKRRKL